ncbi:MAG: class I SAM-dependent methyltransferase, partial [Solirubrobacteraceae bacterium]|nr:class I SAM-dependent methyltransferase [Solirubrobacteraceae bacterium]
MPVHLPCGVCGGALALRFPGGGEAPAPGDLSPSCHRPRAHGDLYRCRECGTVQQPSLPSAGELADLYREMEDDGYMDEEPGRRATAARLLELVERRRRPGRLLEIGCGHGLLLDEARLRGWRVRGLELSASSRRHARDVLGLDVRDERIEQLDPREAGSWDAVLLVDVLEHLDDPAGALRRCHELLAPGGVLCVVTPDPSSLTARAAGARWWGLLPAHTHLLPRATLRELVSAGGLVIADDVPLVRTFSARYWLSGLAERGGPLAAAVRAAAARLPERSALSLSLGDERVVIAVNEPVREPAEALASPR